MKLNKILKELEKDKWSTAHPLVASSSDFLQALIDKTIEQLAIDSVSVPRGILSYDLNAEIRNCPDCKILPGLCASHDF